MNRFLLTAAVLLIFVCAVFSQQTQTDERRDTLKYGIDSEIIELIAVIKDEKNDKFDNDFKELISKTNNSAIKVALSKYFRENDKNLAEDQITAYLKDYDLESNETVIEFLEYVKHFKIKKAEASIARILDDVNPKLLSAAVVALGALNSQEYFADIWELYESDDSDDNVKASVLRALGEARDTGNVEFLTEILENTDEKKSFRWYACEALGKIAASESLKVFYSVWNENDPNMKTFILGALENYTIEDSYHIFEEALRDQNWRVRVEGIKVLGKAEYTPALDILEYKAKNDPETPVRLNAVIAIGKIANPRAMKFLREYCKSAKYTESVRMTAVNILGEKDFSGSASLFREMIAKEWEKDKSKMLDLLCKQFSLYPVSGHEDLFEMMIHHKSSNLRIYAIRGIGLNKISSLKPELEKFTGDRNSESIKRIAREALGQF